MLGALLLYTFPGSPTVFAGDEAGQQGYEDPLNRRTYPWGQEDTMLLACSAAGPAADGASLPAAR